MLFEQLECVCILYISHVIICFIYSSEVLHYLGFSLFSVFRVTLSKLTLHGAQIYEPLRGSLKAENDRRCSSPRSDWSARVCVSGRARYAESPCPGCCWCWFCTGESSWTAQPRGTQAAELLPGTHRPGGNMAESKPKTSPKAIKFLFGGLAG